MQTTIATDAHRFRPLVRFDRTRFRRHALEGSVAYLGVSHAPPGTWRILCRADGAVELHTELRGRVTSMGPGSFQLGRGDPTEGAGVRVRYILPEVLDLGGLEGHELVLDLTETLSAGHCTAEARMFDGDGRLILWAYDGQLPKEGGAYDSTIRVNAAERGRALEVGDRRRRVVLRGPGLTRVDSDFGPFVVLVLRTEEHDAAFIALRS